MRGLKLFFWSGALAISMYGLARICLAGRRGDRFAGGRGAVSTGGEDKAELPGGSFANKAEAVRQLKLGNRPDEAIYLLLRLTETAEGEAAGSGSGIAAWYYEQLAILYRQGDRLAEEVGILERYLSVSEKYGATPARKLKKRLARARELLSGKPDHS